MADFYSAAGVCHQLCLASPSTCAQAIGARSGQQLRRLRASLPNTWSFTT